MEKPDFKSGFLLGGFGDVEAEFESGLDGFVVFEMHATNLVSPGCVDRRGDVAEVGMEFFFGCVVGAIAKDFFETGV